MRRIAIVLAAVLQMIAIGPAAAGDTIFLNATVITMDEAGVIARANVHVSDGRIVAVEPDLLVEMKSDTVLVDATGKFLIPGLAEMHGHLPFAGADRQAALDTLFLYVARGVTTVRGMLGNPVQFELRAEINAGTIAGPNLYLAAPSLNGNSVTSPAQARRLVIKYHGQGWDLQKIHPGLSLAEYDAIFDAADALGFPVGGHVPAEVPLPHAIKRGQISIDHLDGFLRWLGGETRALTEADLQKAVDLVKGTGVWLVPTQALFNLFLEGGDYNELKNREELRYVSPATRSSWRRRLGGLSINKLAAQNRQKLLKALADGGALIALGSDAPQFYSVPGFSIIREIATMKAAGMSARQILISGTVNPGIYFKDKDAFGKIAPGMRADLIMLDADPLADIMNVARQSGVMVNGRWYPKAEIDKRLDEIAARKAGQ